MLLLPPPPLGAYLYKRNRTGNIYHPHAPLRRRSRPPTLPDAGPDRFAWPLYGYTKNHTRFFPAPARVHPPFQQMWVTQRARAARVPASHLRQSHLPARRRRRADSDQQVQRAAPSGRTRSACCPPPRPAVSANTVYATVLSTGEPGIPGRVFAIDYKTGRTRWWRDSAEPERVLAAARSRQALLRLPERHRLRAGRAQRTTSCGPTTPAGAVKASPTLSSGVLYFGDYSGHVQAVSEQTGQRAVAEQLRRRAARQRHVLLDRRGHLRARLPRQHRRARLRLRRLHGQARLGRADGRLRLLLARRHRTRRGSARPSTSAPTAAPSTRSTRARDRSAGSSTPTGASPARRRSSGAPSTSPTSDEHRTYGLGISTGRVRFEIDYRLVRSGDQRRPARSTSPGYTGLYALAPR